MEIKQGDRVKIVADTLFPGDAAYGELLGRTGTVSRIFKDGFSVDLDAEGGEDADLMRDVYFKNDEVSL